MQSTHEYGIVIVAAGRGERAGADGSGPKQYRELGGRPLISRTVDAFGDWDTHCPVVVVRHADDGALLQAALLDYRNDVMVTTGGDTRQASVLRGLEVLAEMPEPPEFVMIHDAARPFVPVTMLNTIAAKLAENPECGVIPAAPVSETLKSVAPDGRIVATVPRDGLYRAQTPQAFPLAGILEVHRQAATMANAEFTDDASLFEWAGLPVRVVAGDNRNIKLTWPRDFKDAERMLQTERETFVPDVRVGHGYDTHQLVAGDRIVLCGISIPHDRQLSGHSDADVGFHALTDALLATIGAGDIGSHFPPSDAQWKGAASHVFLSHAARLVRDGGGRITHCDVTLVCEAPKVSPHREVMRKAISETVGIDVARVSVKATTNEKIGFVGREEGIVAIATATAVFLDAGE